MREIDEMLCRKEEIRLAWDEGGLSESNGDAGGYW